MRISGAEPLHGDNPLQKKGASPENRGGSFFGRRERKKGVEKDDV